MGGDDEWAQVVKFGATSQNGTNVVVGDELEVQLSGAMLTSALKALDIKIGVSEWP